MAHHPSHFPVSHCLPVHWTELFTRPLTLGWFGVSPHSDVAKGVAGNHRVAVKRFRPRRTPELCEKDLKIALKKWEKVFSHPNIQNFLGLSKEDSWNFPHVLLTPYREFNLTDYINENSSADRMALASHVASALKYMHSQDPPITHGNVKGSNILVDGNGTVYLTDIGIHQALSNPERVGSEVRWSAPEKVLDGQPNTPACDVWSFAMTTLEMFTRQPPFQNHIREETIVLAMERGDVPPRPIMDVRVWNLLVECWKYLPSRRPSMTAIFSRISSLKDDARKVNEITR